MIRKAVREDAEVLSALAIQMWTEHDCEIDNDDSLRFHIAMGFEETNRIICFKKGLKRQE